MRMKILLNYVIFSAIILVACGGNPLPQVEIQQGTIQGHLKKSFGGRSFAAFEGIPYAKPPIGDLRFAEPQFGEPWKGTWNATNLYTCMQPLRFSDIIIGDEDCLYLNVYVPEKKLNSAENLEVIVHIHGGAFLTGSGHEYCHPEYLMDRDVVYVSLNYRLGIFGFLSTGDKELPGNNGLKDQTLALKWIQQNVRSFGGNPDSVTLTGLSAGGASAHLHYFSPLSKGLFHRGMAQSGVALSSWAVQEGAPEKAKKLAIVSGCPHTNTKNLVSCLRQRPAKQIYSKLKEFQGAFRLPIVPFAPVVEKGLPNAFLPEYPYVMLKQKKSLDVPLIISSTSEEGLLVSTMFEDHLDILNENWVELAPLLLDFNRYVSKSLWEDTAKKIKDYFIAESEDFTKENLGNFTKMLSDRFFFSYGEIAARLHAKVNKAPVYYYQFKYENANTFTRLISPTTKLKGVCHVDDAQYLFADLMPGFTPPSDTDLKMKDLFIDMLITYAKTNVPKFSGLNWDPTGSDVLSYLEIVNPSDMKMRTDKDFSALSLWRNVNILENKGTVNPKVEL